VTEDKNAAESEPGGASWFEIADVQGLTEYARSPSSPFVDTQ
jgi:hypothetical protein